MNPPHGGPRKGAGRKPQGVAAKVKTSAAIDPDLLAEIDAAAQRLGITRNKAIETAIREWVLAHKNGE